MEADSTNQKPLTVRQAEKILTYLLLRLPADKEVSIELKVGDTKVTMYRGGL